MGRHYHNEDVLAVKQLYEQKVIGAILNPDEHGRIPFERGIDYSLSMICDAYASHTRENHRAKTFTKFYELTRTGHEGCKVLNGVAVVAGEAVPEVLPRPWAKLSFVDEPPSTHQLWKRTTWKDSSLEQRAL